MKSTNFDFRYKPNRQIIFIISLIMLGMGNLIISENLSSSIIGNYLIVVLAIVAFNVIYNLPRVINYAWYFPVLIFIIFGFVPGFFIDEITEYGNLKMYGLLIALILVIAPTSLANPEKSVEYIIIGIFTISMVISVYLLFSGVQGNFGRGQIVGLNPIGVARVTSIATIVTFTVFLLHWHELKTYRWWAMILCVVSIIATVFTGSRGPLASAAIALVFVILLALKRKRIKFRSLIMLIALLIALSYLLPKLNIAGFTRILTADDSGRNELYALSLQIFANHPNGVGWGNLSDYVNIHNPLVEGTLYAHNIFIEAAVEGGWIALLMTIVLVLMALVNSFKATLSGIRVAPYTMCILVYLLANAQVSSDIVGNRMLWLFIGISLIPIKAYKVQNFAKPIIHS